MAEFASAPWMMTVQSKRIVITKVSTLFLSFSTAIEINSPRLFCNCFYFYLLVLYAVAGARNILWPSLVRMIVGGFHEIVRDFLIYSSHFISIKEWKKNRTEISLGRVDLVNDRVCYSPCFVLYANMISISHTVYWIFRTKLKLKRTKSIWFYILAKKNQQSCWIDGLSWMRDL